MSRATPEMRGLAERLIAHEARGRKSSGVKAPPSFDASERLRPWLATLMGTTGSRALLARALVLAGAQAPWLRAVHVRSDGSLEGLDELDGQVAPHEITEGKVLLLAQLLGLLVAFIGEDLTLRLVREAWPRLSLNELDAGSRRQE